MYLLLLPVILTQIYCLTGNEIMHDTSWNGRVNKLVLLWLLCLHLIPPLNSLMQDLHMPSNSRQIWFAKSGLMDWSRF